MGRRRIRGIDPRSFDRFHVAPLLGIDEVGLGAIAGPICVAGAILPRDRQVTDLLHEAGLRDSKEMTGLSREKVYELLMEHAVWHTHAFAWCWELEEDGYSATLDRLYGKVIAEAYNRDVEGRAVAQVVLDGNARPNLPYQHEAVQKGDQKSQTIAAASVIAKVTRDRLMVEMSADYPGYDFHNNVGYGTRTHLRGLKELGPCEIHRQNTKPVKKAKGLAVPKRSFKSGWR
jgi:ribonuclease HII